MNLIHSESKNIKAEKQICGGVDTQSTILKEIVKERKCQDTKWRKQNHRIEFWTGLLGEEYGELCEAINEAVFDNGPAKRKKGGYENMRKKAIHVAAVAVGFLECIERNKRNWGL